MKEASILLLAQWFEDENAKTILGNAEILSEDFKGDTAKIVFICKKVKTGAQKDIVITLDMKKIDGDWKVASFNFKAQ